MNQRYLSGVLSVWLVIGMAAVARAEATSAQSTGSVSQDVHAVGQAIKEGAVQFGHGVKRAASEVGHGAAELGRGVKRGAVAVGHGVKQGAHVAGEKVHQTASAVHDTFVRDSAPAPVEHASH